MRFEAYFAQSDRCFEDHVFPTPDGLTIFYRDVTERRRLREQLVRLAQHDPLTGLANRALFGERLEQGLQSSRRQRDLASSSRASTIICNPSDSRGYSCCGPDRFLQSSRNSRPTLTRLTPP
ncbi:MAG TPA: hypothetical protein VMO81_05010 [Aestuariivirgaceae bacterium]|nr:hypothetical protein [Aestuariivirgaceae bacterium]